MGNTVTVPAIKVVIPLRPEQIPPGLVPAEPAPVGAPVLNVQLAGTGIVVAVHLSGKNARKTLKLLAQHGPDSVNLVVNGTLKPGPQAGTWMVAEASFQSFIKPPAAPISGSASGTGDGSTSAADAAPDTGTASNLTQPPK